MSQDPDPILELIDILIKDELPHEILSLILKGLSSEEIIDTLVKKMSKMDKND